MRRFLARAVLAISRYKITGTPPEDPVCVLVAAPHTSNWDFFLMLAMAWDSGISPVWLGKKEMFWGPLAPLFRSMGGIAVDRENAGGLAESIAERARAGHVSAVVIPAEATRSRGTYWKSGFRRIAADAGIPMVLTYLDGPTRTGGYGPSFHPTADVVADMDRVRAFYADKHGLRPDRFTPPRLREEESVAAEAS
ncbi:1-acyl-sn-glycerol-3-phosphate acyltransferase [Aquihabitans sp. McL0605]|uniref:1-acyl-sn-glycerol-3-phosphate acyltransferase n=1 Tax=Aquihabitans sp. McL0605 TaxID=3415671 RepID=UPI003CE67654